MPASINSFASTQSFALERAASDWPGWTTDELIELAAEMEPSFEPGTSFTYSNSNTVLLGRIVELLTGNPLHVEMRSRLFEPLGLERTFYAGAEAIPGGLGLGHATEFAQVFGATETPMVVEERLATLIMTTGGASGSLVGTASDVVRFDQALFGGELLEEATLAEMVTPSPVIDSFVANIGAPDIGGGLHVFMYPFPEPIGTGIGHDGGEPGFTSFMLTFPEHDISVAVLVNDDRTDFSVFPRGEDVDALMGEVVRVTLEGVTGTEIRLEGATTEENVYEDPQGRFSMPLIGSWERLDTDEPFALFQVPGVDFTMAVLTVETDDLAVAEMAALRLVGIDPEVLTQTGSTGLGDWSVTFYSRGAGQGVTPLCQERDGVSYCLVAMGDESLTLNPPQHVMTTIQAFAVTGAETALPSTIDAFEAYLGSFVGDNPAGLSIVITLGDEVLYAKGFGMADAPKGMTAEPDTVWLWGSMVKVVTATAIMQLVDEGLVELDAPISEYLEYAPAEHGITVRQLLSHSAGLSEAPEFVAVNIELGGQPLPDSERVARAYFEGFGGPAFEPGSASSYSNPGFVLLGQIVAAVSGQPYTEYVQENVLTPLGMANTGFTYSGEMIAKAAAPALPAGEVDGFVAMVEQLRGDGEVWIREVDDRHGWLHPYHVEAAHGGLIGPATEAIRFAQMHLNGGELAGVRILSPESTGLMREMQVSSAGDPLGFGLSWFVSGGERRFVEHGGGGVGLWDLMRIYPDDGVAIVMMSNGEGFDRGRVLDAAANVVFTMLAGPAQAPEVGATGEETDLTAALQGLLDEQVQEQGILGMAMAVRSADGTIIGGGSGFTDPSGEQPWTIDTQTAIGSVTKTFTAVVVMQLVEEGRLSLDDTIDAWFPDQPGGDRITVRMLLSHTSGLANYISGDNVMEGKWHREWTPTELVAEANSLGAVDEPGSGDAHYANTNFILLGMIIEEITGNSWAQEITSRIIEPLDLKSTTFLSAEGVLSSIVGGYSRSEAGFQNLLDAPVYPHPSTTWSAGELVSSVSDLMTFASALLDEGLVSRETLAVMAQPLGTDVADGILWGLGGGTVEEFGVGAFGMGGDIPGYHAFFMGFLDNDILVAAVANTEEGDVIGPSFGAVQYLASLAEPAPAAEVFTPAITDASGNPQPGSVASLEQVTLGGVDQWILIRGADTTKPVLLVLHGGPGFAMTPWLELYQRPALEENFVVVNWDQRGAGKSYSPDLTAEDMTVAKLVSDTLELTELLREGFGQDKIFLTGHSWGSALGFLAIMENPEPYHAYIASAEAAHWNRRQQLSYDWVLEQARSAGDSEVVEALAGLGPFDPTSVSQVGIKDQFLDRYRGGDYYTEGLWDEYLAYALEGRSPAYTQAEIETYVAGLELSGRTLGPEIAQSGYDLFRDFPVSPIPIHFLVGRHDHSTPGELAEEYYEVLEAPAKSFTWFENSGHTLMFDEPDRWAEELIRIARETLVE